MQRVDKKCTCITLQHYTFNAEERRQMQIRGVKRFYKFSFVEGLGSNI